LLYRYVCFVQTDRILKWSVWDGFYNKGLNQTYNRSSFGKPRTMIIVGLCETKLIWW